jgi:hypothetical protein
MIAGRSAGGDPSRDVAPPVAGAPYFLPAASGRRLAR